MKRPFFFILILIAAAILVAGCSQPSSPGPATAATTVPTTAAPTTIPGTPPASPTAALPDYRTDPLPSDKAVAIGVDRNTVNPMITVTYRGGPGINFVALMEVVLTRSDGVVLTDSLRKPQVNDQISLEGTREVSESRADRVQVFITLVTGNKHLIYDQALPYKSRG